MAVETALYSALSGATAVTALTGLRIYPLMAPDAVQYPYVTYQRVSSEREYALGGYSSVEKPRIQVDCYSTSYTQAKALSSAVHTTLRSATAFAATLEVDYDLFEDVPGLFRVTQDFSIINQA